MSGAFNRAEFIATFKTEAEEHLGKLSKGLVVLEKNPDDAELLKELFRVAHTLKGVARMMGFFEIQEIAHRIEDIFGALTEKNLKFSSEIANKTFKALDSIKIILDKIIRGQHVDIDVSVVCSELELCLVSRDSKSLHKELKAQSRAKDKKEERKKESPAAEEEVIKKKEESFLETVNNSTLPQASPAPIDEYVRVSLSRINKLLNLLGEMVINKIKASQKIIALKKITKSTKEHQKRLSVFFDDFKNNDDFKNSADFKRSLDVLHQCNVDAEKIKEEMAAIFEEISNEAIHMDPIIDELQQRMKEIRMLSCSTIFDDFPRLVRDIAFEQAKKINLIVKGDETELDKKVLEAIKDPLIHILRNCVDHGIELPEERKAAGKNEEGTIRIYAAQEGGQVVIEVSDDGRGLNIDKIKEIILKKRLASEIELHKMNEEEVSLFIFRSGFSTSPIITDISGRGVGLDIVKTQIDKLKGKVHITFEKGKGTKIILELPLTIAIIDVLLANVNAQSYAFPMLSIEEILKIKPSDISTVENKMAIRVRERTVALVRLSDVLGLPAIIKEDEERRNKEELNVIIVTSLEKRVGFIVDTIVAEQEVFIKSLGPHLGKIKNIAGATVLGTGKVIVILDVADLIASSRMDHSALAQQKTFSIEEKAKKKILVVEDSLTTRELERSILESQGYHVNTAIDGLDALDKLAQVKYDLIVCDVQMPRMDGFEFCKTFKQKEQYKDIPLIFVTALAKEEDKRRGIEVGAQAYIVKSAFDQTNLLETIERLAG
ncbi:MAG: hybrid sensor histidine kinase/response regulator [Candidatus Omnitrophota bacterium]|nr:hybrid sensor histidine kinase/response regulator [Candidatus Omnitrophota bacterium]